MQIHHHADKDSARKFKLKKESTMVYLDDKLETSDLKKNGVSNGSFRRHDGRDASEINMQSHESSGVRERVHEGHVGTLLHLYDSAIVSKTTQWEREL
jgi:hypothetical protein